MNELEFRLRTPRLAFQKLIQAPRGRQFKILRNVVYVVAEVSNVLPRLPNDTGTIKENLKRKLQYKTNTNNNDITWGSPKEPLIRTRHVFYSNKLFGFCEIVASWLKIANFTIISQL